MEKLFDFTSLILLLILLAFPVGLLLSLRKLKSKGIFIPYFVIGIIGLTIIIFTMAWNSHYSKEVRMNHYGYTFEELGNYDNVDPKNLEKVKSLETSLMGVGWQIKAIMPSVVFIIPYLLIIYPIKFVIDKLKEK